ncbi:MAG: DUF1178 family protein [Rhodospirillales bacterium]|nr:DUF1178 family protein [Rhodospirillales bacterium]
MILFELKCRADHHFEAWFRDGATYEAQVAAGEVSCPVCGEIQVDKAPMAPRLAKSRGDRGTDIAVEMRKALTELRRQVESNCDYVGERFPDEARAIHYGEREARAIYGEASAKESRALKDEGIEVRQIPWLPGQEN